MSFLKTNCHTNLYQDFLKWCQNFWYKRKQYGKNLPSHDLVINDLYIRTWLSGEHAKLVIIACKLTWFEFKPL